MLVYIIVIVLLVLALYASYRAFGGANNVPPAPAMLLVQALESVVEAGATLALVASAAEPETRPDDLRAGRQAIATAQHCIDLMPADADLGESLRQARMLLARATEDISWSWRLVSTPGWHANPGLHEAVASLSGAAKRCTDDARPLVALLLPEPVEGGG